MKIDEVRKAVSTGNSLEGLVGLVEIVAGLLPKADPAPAPEAAPVAPVETTNGEQA